MQPCLEELIISRGRRLLTWRVREEAVTQPEGGERERERERARASRKGQREGERIGSRLWAVAQSLMQGSNSRTVRSRPEPKSRVRRLTD